MSQIPNDAQPDPWKTNPWENGAKFDENGEPVETPRFSSEIPNASAYGYTADNSLAGQYAYGDGVEGESKSNSAKAWIEGVASESFLDDGIDDPIEELINPYGDLVEMPEAFLYDDVFLGIPSVEKKNFQYRNVLSKDKPLEKESLAKTFQVMGIVEDDNENLYLPIKTLKLLLERGSPLNIKIDFSTQVKIGSDSYYPLIRIGEAYESDIGLSYSLPASPGEHRDVKKFQTKSSLTGGLVNHGYREVLVNEKSGLLTVSNNRSLYYGPSTYFLPEDSLSELLEKGAPLILNIDFSNLYFIGSKLYYKIKALEEPSKSFKSLVYIDDDDFPSGEIVWHSPPPQKRCLREALRSLDPDIFEDLKGAKALSVRMEILEYSGLDMHSLKAIEDGIFSFDSCHPPGALTGVQELTFSRENVEKVISSINTELGVNFDDFEKEKGNNPQLQNKDDWIVDPEAKNFSKKQGS